MPTTLNPLIRYRTIDKCLRNQENKWTWKELATACSNALLEQIGIQKEISRRTIMYDIKNMRSGKLGYQAPIEYDKVDGYFYSDLKFSIDHVPLGKEELNELTNALLILKQFSGKESVKGLENIVTSLEETLKIKKGKHREIIQFDHSLNEPGQKWVNQVYEGIKNKQCLSLNYQPFDKKNLYAPVSPYLLKEYNNRWFLFGYNHQHKTIATYGLDRIQSITPSLQSYYEAETFDSKTYLDDILGVSFNINHPLEQVLIKAYGKQRLYIETKPIHHTQTTIEMTDTHAVFCLQLIPNYELESRILGYGETVEILSPEYLRVKIQRRLETSLDRYNTIS